MTTNDDDFWGNHADWPEVPEGTRREPRAGAGKTVSRWWNNVVGGGSTANREHGGSRGHATHPIDLEDEPLSINQSGEHAVVRPNSVEPSTQAVRRTGDRRPAQDVRDTSGAETSQHRLPPSSAKAIAHGCRSLVGDGSRNGGEGGI